MGINEFATYIISQFTAIGQSLIAIVKILINIAVVSFDFISQFLKMVSNYS